MHLFVGDDGVVGRAYDFDLDAIVAGELVQRSAARQPTSLQELVGRLVEDIQPVMLVACTGLDQ